LCAGVAANIRSRVRGRNQRRDAFFGRLACADFPERYQTGRTGIDVGQGEHAGRPTLEFVSFETSRKIVPGRTKQRP
jgi:hypothetical protein